MTLSGYLKIGAALALAGALFAGHHAFQGWKDDLRDEGRADAKAECKAAADAAEAAQETREKELQAKVDQAEKDLETSRAEFENGMRVRQNELRKTSANLRACRLNDATVRLLNDSGEAARRAAGHPGDPGQRGQPLPIPAPSQE